jgi:hypothetical protein
MAPREISIVLPVRKEDPALEGMLGQYTERLTAMGVDWELVLVPAPDGVRGGHGAVEQCHRITSLGECVSVVGPVRGWGAAVSAGLGASSRAVLCYTNWQRTPVHALVEMVELAFRNPELVLRANRRTRDTRIRRVGSLLYNLECRLLLQIPVWDVNGTPKIFPRSFGELLRLDQTGDLFDAELAFICERSGYPVMEVPIDAECMTKRSGGVGPVAALRMYLGVPSVRARLRR